ncbi:MAG: DedA family protein [Eubacterium sp.]|jgi:uncharacterized membrane protein YdjX (TVP38/TMEM64 family)|nr:DedA family protein [Eubacterium sp.]
MKKFKWKLSLSASIIVLLLLVMYFSAFDFHHVIHRIRKLNLESIEQYIKSYGSWSIAAFLVISTIRPIAVIIPITLMTLIAGGIYGPVYGFILAMVSIFISSNVAFFISRYFGKTFVERLIRKRADKINVHLENNGFKIILLMRLSGVFPLDLVSYTAGLTKVKYKEFIIATMIGSAPETFSVAYMGHHINNPLSPGFILSVVMVLVTVGIPLIYNKIKAKKGKDEKDLQQKKKIV